MFGHVIYVSKTSLVAIADMANPLTNPNPPPVTVKTCLLQLHNYDVPWGVDYMIIELAVPATGLANF